MNKAGCVLLAGGAGRRMGKQNKLNMPLGASSFGEIIKQELRLLTDKCYISVAEYPYEIDDDFKPVLDVIKDDNESFIGPMGGIYSTLKQALADGLIGVFVVSCDMPFFKGEIFKKLEPYIATKDIVLLKSSDGHIHYTCGYYSTNTLPAFYEMIKLKKYRIRDIINRCDCLIVESEKLDINDQVFCNINDFEQYESLKFFLGGSMYQEHKLRDAERTKLTSSFLNTFEKRIHSNPPGVCPISTHIAYLRTARSQTCGKCIPCAKGLEQLENMMQKILDGEGTMDDYIEMYWLTNAIKEGADCAIGYEAAYMVQFCINNYKDEYLSHINNHKCHFDATIKVPCMYNCPANVNIPGYVALISEEKYEDAVNLIREDNPFPTACAFVCEKPCELQCRRSLIDAPINVRGLKRYAVEKASADTVKTPKRNIDTGKRIAIVGGGPSGLTCAYFLARMGHNIVVYESNDKLGGMLRYGIPNYRLPKDRLDEDIRGILAVGGIEVKYNTYVGKDVSMDELRENFDAVYISIGAQKGRVIPIENYDHPEVYSAVEMLHKIGCGEKLDLTGKDVVVIGGGNVAMDCARSAIRCNAKSVTLSVREHQEDMTALPEEIQGAIEEGVALLTMYAPSRIKVNDEGHIEALVTKPQITSNYAPNTGMPMVRDADKPEFEIPCQVVYMAVGQEIVSEPFGEYSIDKRKNFITDNKTYLKDYPGIFAGGDCVSGPATAIKAIGAGKIAAINIDEYLGYNHSYNENIDIPEAKSNYRHHMGRVNLNERFARERRNDFDSIELNMSHEEAMQECNKCLRCDVYGSGCMEGGLV